MFPELNGVDLESAGAAYTAQEISGQPELWLETYQALLKEKDQLQNFLNPILEKPGLQIIFTGAGTSAFIGEVLQGIFQKERKVVARAIATTDLVTHPEYYFLPSVPTLLISFARSGNSPESVKAMELANAMCREIYHLVITCNESGALAQQAAQGNGFVFLLPPRANDQSLAMTGSFTSMLLSGLLIARLPELQELESQVKRLASYGHRILTEYPAQLMRVAELPFKRAVFLGSGIFQGIARESHLKLQELTDGQVICKFDTFLGFRHGPKAVIDEQTLMVYIFSNQHYPQLYEIDLVQSVYEKQKGIWGISVSEQKISKIKTETEIVYGDARQELEESFLTVVSVLPAQMLGFYKSLNLNLAPDHPSKRGAISRVVQGVKLYPYKNQLV